jgi:ABC-type phosphate/phosphonate transport system ATPase subunit
MMNLPMPGLRSLAERDANRISGGQRQLALVARALAQSAGAIMMDEPTASLDLANRLMVLAARICARIPWRSGPGAGFASRISPWRPCSGAST